MVKVTKNYDDDGNDDGGGQSDYDKEDDYDVIEIRNYIFFFNKKAVAPLRLITVS